MKIGISNASLYPVNTEEALKFLGENGVKVTEVFFNSPSELEEAFLKNLKSIAEYYDIEIATVHPCGSVGEPYFLFSDYIRRYKDSFEFYKKYYNALSILGGKAVVLHGDSLSGHISMEEYCERLLSMNEEAERYGATVCHENVNRYRAATPENVKQIRKLTNDRIKFTFDIKQAVRDGCGIDAMYEAMRGNIVNVHISDHTAEKDCLLPLKGDFDFGKLFKRLKADGYDGACLIEVYRNAYTHPLQIIESGKLLENLEY